MEHIRCMCCEDGDDEAGYVCEECRKAYPSANDVSVGLSMGCGITCGMEDRS